ncbi:aspartyl-phosphate phosphatase Spo0E family protein [Bacillus albus]|uniref:aspartyl-phosphate phosphatase Spo0E family protein n=1 Tax=Bacillus albus TaxID=2026189 RepID=UPI00101FD749|nr:aspartyl-phosphate phosphatase Spo0E family protein [Bacillus albus]
MDMKLLYDTIENKKKELNYLVKIYGLRDSKVINISQKLDHLVYTAMRKYQLNQKTG